jgi:acyl transferase domain-containing protein/NADPH:quinone reductase-like Zn-dependent oxidoreductase/NAD(P)-dependent dehydrogenase (short-subunit alcohol dehydrogenase family)/acyl carrier protein
MKPDTEETTIFELPSAVAIIGMAGRFPGARSLDQFRRNLEDGVESITVFSDQELAQAGVDRKMLSNPGYVKAAPLLEDADKFDASFFEYSPREAIIMDPQQRLFLECAWEALEDAAHAGDASGSLTGVFSGAGGIMSTYLLSDTHFNPQLTGTTASLQHVGNDKDYLSTRVSYKLNLRGPSLSVQTACSTSLVAVHLACQSLLTGECDMALAGGTTVRVPQRAGYLYREGNVFSRDGHCRAFDADAQGTVFGSGIGVVVLKRLKDAIADGDAIRAVIRGTAINNDGSENKTSYWAPHADGQADAMRRALSVARVAPSTIGYVEGHGTATKKGDPTEIRALTQAFGPLPGGSCAIGSVKSNIGHPESAAGVAGLIKTVLSLERKAFFPSLHYSRPNPEIDFAHGFYVSTTRKPWAAKSFPRRAAVNSLGIGGTNAFVILEEAPEPHAAATAERSCHVLALSAKSEAALDALTQRFHAYLEEHPTDSLGDICYSANVGRAHFERRLALVASSTSEATQLAAAVASAERIQSDYVERPRPPRIAFLFTGQGSQYVEMARELYQTDATFREVFDRCAEKLSPYLEQPLLGVLYPTGGQPSPINDTSYTQPALFAVEYALATRWRAWGIQPAVLLGHSVGEIVAACVAGVMSLEDGLRLVAARGRLMQALPRDGGMAAVRCGAAGVAEAIAPYGETVSIAAINGPNDVVISGRLEHVDAIVTRVEGDGVTATRLNVSHAFHSPLMQPMLAEFERVARAVTYSQPAIPLISNVTGALATAEIASPEYWVRHVMAAVRFADGIAAAHAQGVDVFLEIGPAPVLLGMARQCVPNGPEAWLPSLRPGRSDWRQISESVAALYVRGVNVDWSAFYGDARHQRVHLPTYPFQRQRYWMEAPATGAAIPSSSSSLVGQRLRLPSSPEIRFETRWSRHSPPYLDDHRIFDTVVVPGASHIAMTLSALNEIARQDSCVLEDVVFPQALTLSDDSIRTAQLILTKGKDGDTSFQVVSLRDGEDENESGSWVVHATGKIGRADSSPLAANAQPSTGAVTRAVDPAEWQARCVGPSSGTRFYDKFWQAGYHLRGAFRWISNTWAGDGEVLCEFTWPELPDEPSAYLLYPSLIDACFQAVFSDTASELLKADAVYVPFSVRRFRFLGSPQPGSRLWCHAAVTRTEGARNSVDANITLCEDSGRVLAYIENCQLREVRREALLHALGRDLSDSLYEVEWQAEPRGALAAPVDTRDPGAWIVFTDAAAVGDALIERLQAHGQRCIRVVAGSHYRLISTDSYEINGAAPQDVRRLLDDVAGDDGLRCRGIVHLWSLDTAPMEDLSNASSRECVIGSVLHLVQAMAQARWPGTPRLWLVTRGSQPVEPLPTIVSVQQAPLWGLGRVIALEHPELQCVRVDLDPLHRIEHVQQLFDDVWAPGEHDQLAYRRGIRYVPRLVRCPAPRNGAADDHDATPGSEPFRVGLSSYGQLDNLTLRPLTRRVPGPGEVEVQVRAAGINFRDVLNALGLLEAHYARLGVTSAADMTFGFECAGTVVAVGDDVADVAVGDEVIAVATHDALGAFVTLRAEFVVHKPAALTFEEAATLPLAFLTAYYGLHHLAKLRRGDRVLIHAAAGGVGLACVRWAQQVGAEVFATASPGKWQFLKSAGVDHVMHSRTLDFAAAIRQATGGEGVDVVVNTLSGEFVDESFAILKPGGRFIELGKRDVWSDDRVRERRPDVAYFPFDLMEVSRRDPKAIAALLGEMKNGLRDGTLTPLPLTVFPAAKVVDAFRYMAEARHIGKIAVAMPPLRTNAGISSRPIREDGSYLITGGLGALGLEIARCLVQQGARHIVLVSRRQAAGESRLAVERLEQGGADVRVLEADVSDPAQVRRLLAAVREALPPLRGIVHAAGVLDDGVLMQQTWERFRKVMAPKVEGAWNLHAMTQDLPLDFFVCFSSVASLVGNAGQGNYAAANAFMDALAHHRRGRGLPALSINWGPWGDVGMAAEGSGHRQRRLADQGFRPIAPDEGVQLFSQLLGATRAQVGVLPITWSEFLRINAAGGAFFDRVATRTTRAPKEEPDIRRQLAAAPDPRGLLAHHVRSVVGKVLGMREPGAIDARARLFDLGLESLMAVELRGRFEDSLGCPLRPTLLFDYPTIEALVEHLAGKLSEHRDDKVSAHGVPDTATVLADELESLDEDEIARRLAQELWASTRAQGR